MTDRVPTYPGRVRLTPVSGQTNVYDLTREDSPTVIGDALNKGNLLPDSVATALGLTGNPQVKDALLTLTSAMSWKKITEYTSAGAYTWTAPDIYGDGRQYEIGVLVIGGGGSGYATLDSNSSYPYGGASGCTLCFTMSVTPGGTYGVVVGAGGEGRIRDTSGLYGGNNGESSSFDGNVAYGATGTYGAQRPVESGTIPSNVTNNPFGGVVTAGNTAYTYSAPNECFNPFEGKKILGAGGVASSNANYRLGGKDPTTGLGGGHAAYNASTGLATGEDATAPGCGGGAARVYGATGTATSGSGADGAVYIYARERVS